GLALFDAVAFGDVDARKVQEVRADAVAVVDHHGAAGEVQARVGEAHDARGRGLHGSAGGRGDVHPGVPGARLAVVDAATAEAAADAPFDRAHEALGEVGAVVVPGARGGDACLLAADAFGDRGRRVDGLRRHAVDALHRPVTRIHGDAGPGEAAVRADDRDPQRARGIAADAEHDRAVAGAAQHAVAELDA